MATDQAAPRRRKASPTADLARPLDHIAFVVGRAWYNYLAVVQRLLDESGLNKHLRPGMGWILFALFEKDDQVIKELVQRAGVSYSTLSGMLAHMRRAGLVACHRDPHDGRAVRVRLTPLGESLRLRCLASLGRMDSIMCGNLPPEQVESARQTLGVMIGALRTYQDLPENRP